MDMTRSCNCSGGCGPSADEDGAHQENQDEGAGSAGSAAGVSRRAFLTLTGAGAAGLLLGAPAPAQTVAPKTPVQEEELARWKRALQQATPPRLYRSDVHTDARMHLGGIGTGNLEIGADGQLTTWQLFNTLRDGHVPLYFSVRAGQTTKILQTQGGPDWPRVRAIEMRGEYPFAFLRFVDPDLPVRLEMTAFTPFAPFDTRLSSMPLAAFVFRIHNPTPRPQTISLAALMPNPVGYEAMGEISGMAHPNFGGNVNELRRDGSTAMLAMRAEAGRTPTLDRPLQLFTNINIGALNTPPTDRPKTLAVEPLERLASDAAAVEKPDTASRIVWIENAPESLSEPTLRAAREAVRRGATLVFAGEAMPLLQTYARLTGGQSLDKAALRPDVLFEDFENGYDRWTVEGEALGARPAGGTPPNTLPNQQRVSGFRGQGLVNTYLRGDDTTGRLISRPFVIERNFIRFLVGGGSHPTTQIRLLVGGKVVRAASGRDNERLLPATWDVRDLKGQNAHIEIVDEQTGPWGHINADHIEFGDALVSSTVMELLAELLPARFSDIKTNPQAGTLAFENLQLLPDSRQTTSSHGLPLITRAVGAGQVVLAGGAILKPREESMTGARQRAYAALGEMVGARYQPANGVLPDAPGFGTLALATTGPNSSGVAAFSDWNQVWQSFETGGFSPLTASSSNTPTATGQTVGGALASTVTLAPGQSVEVPFFLAWRYPNKYNADAVWIGNHYATLWPDANSVIRETAASFAGIREKTERFHKTFYDSTLPYWLLDCMSSQAGIIRHIGVVFRIANGDIYGWEGSNGCCAPTCTHVWGYEQTLARLFPDLEREMRRIDYKHQQRADGGINTRTDVPSPPHPTGQHPFADGHASCVLKAYREAMNHSDDAWLREYWPGIKRAVEYLIARDTATSQGVPDGTLEDDQWNTYDNAIHGVNSFIGSYYLAALRAGENLARRLGEHATADRYHAIFEKGQKKLIELCWNGEYFQQHLPGYEKRAGEYGPGCLSDQLVGQWWAHQLGLGYLLPQEHVRSALRAIFKYNWLTDHTNWKHTWRKFAGGRDKGLLNCTWPRGGRPVRTIPYADEVWTGVEYQVAAHMIYEGMTDEAFAVVKGVRDRYDGVPRPPIPRNPWSEIECGGHYARAMASWSLLLALSGFEYDGPAEVLRFAPRLTPHNFKSFFSGPEGWGALRQTRRGKMQSNEITVVEGRLTVARLHLQPPAAPKSLVVTVGATRRAATMKSSTDGVVIALARPLTLNRGETLKVVVD